jgi:acetylornithine deacetylase
MDAGQLETRKLDSQLSGTCGEGMSTLSTLSDLVAINSINLAYEDGVSEEGVARYVDEFFRSRKIETFRQSVMPGRSNVIARVPGIVLEAHMDTVSVSGMTIPPFDPVVRDGLLYGRGSCDTKAGLAAMMHAVASLEDPPPCEVWLAAVVDEEFSFQGILALCDGLRADAAIVAEPTSLRAVIASKGVLRWKIRTRGKAAHSSKPHLGINAISHMAQIISAFDRDAESLTNRAHPLLGPATVNVGVIRGGVQVNFVPDWCEIEVDRRLLPQEEPDLVLASYASMLNDLQSENSQMDVSMDPPMIVDPALETRPDQKVAVVAQDVLRALNLEESLVGVPYGSDASKLSRHGVPSIIFGPGSIDRAHAAVEYVECAQVELAADFYRNFLLRFE